MLANTVRGPTHRQGKVRGRAPVVLLLEPTTIATGRHKLQREVPNDVPRRGVDVVALPGMRALEDVPNVAVALLYARMSGVAELLEAALFECARAWLPAADNVCRQGDGG